MGPPGPDPGVIEALRRAVAAGADVALQVHLAELELAAGLREDAITTLSAVLAASPSDPVAAALMVRALQSGATTPPAGLQADQPPGADRPGVGPPGELDYDWKAAADDLGIDVPPPFVDHERARAAVGPLPADKQFAEVERPRVTLADVGGMEEVKARLNAAFLAPLRNPELRAAYAKSLRGGLLMYGPPGCGKTFIARALAGELRAKFIAASAADVLDVWVGASERNVHDLFMRARREAPCVVFLDELDALGARRSTRSSDTLQNVVNQLLTELDGVSDDNEGVFILGATNQPWQVDNALRRPGRFDRTVLVLPPDAPAREAIFRGHLTGRPVAGIDLGALAGMSEGLTGADIAYACEAAAERALMDSAATGQVRPIGMADMAAAVREVAPSIGQWLETVKNVVQFGEDDGTFGELRAYLKKARRL
jgi:SpoVK/Ycf46/Vps4 family AAA+-type ATPase